MVLRTDQPATALIGRHPLRLTSDTEQLGHGRDLRTCRFGAGRKEPRASGRRQICCVAVVFVGDVPHHHFRARWGIRHAREAGSPLSAVTSVGADDDHLGRDRGGRRGLGHAAARRQSDDQRDAGRDQLARTNSCHVPWTVSAARWFPENRWPDRIASAAPAVRCARRARSARGVARTSRGPNCRRSPRMPSAPTIAHRQQRAVVRRARTSRRRPSPTDGR